MLHASWNCPYNALLFVLVFCSYLRMSKSATRSGHDIAARPPSSLASHLFGGFGCFGRDASGPWGPFRDASSTIARLRTASACLSRREATDGRDASGRRSPARMFRSGTNVSSAATAEMLLAILCITGCDRHASAAAMRGVSAASLASSILLLIVPYASDSDEDDGKDGGSLRAAAQATSVTTSRVGRIVQPRQYNYIVSATHYSYSYK